MLIYSIFFVKHIALTYLCVNIFTYQAKAKYPAPPPRKGHIALRNGENVTHRVSVGDTVERPKTTSHSLNNDFAQEWLVVFVVNEEKRMGIDFVFFDGQLWTYDEWAKIAPLTLLCPEIEPITQASFYDPDPTAKLD